MTTTISMYPNPAHRFDNIVSVLHNGKEFKCSLSEVEDLQGAPAPLHIDQSLHYLDWFIGGNDNAKQSTTQSNSEGCAGEFGAVPTYPRCEIL